MAHGTPDWNVTSGRVTTHQLTDLGELAVRLGSIVSFDRRGDVIWYDSFEDGLVARWVLTETGAGSSVARTMERVRTGAYSARLIAGDVGGSRAAITHYCPFSVLSAFGLEVAISREVILTALQFNMDLYDGTNVTEFRLRWELSGSTLKYQDAAGSWVTLGAVPLSTEETLWHVFKLVGDGVNGDYERAIVNNQPFPLVDIPARVQPSAILPVLFFQVSLYGDAGTPSQAWVDDVIVTQNEPVD